MTATDSSGGSGPYAGTRSYTLGIGGPTLALTPTSLASATVGVTYSASIAASGGTAPYAYAVTAGALPAGLVLAADGTLSGTPTAGGSFGVTITATDAGGFAGAGAIRWSLQHRPFRWSRQACRRGRRAPRTVRCFSRPAARRPIATRSARARCRPG
ncbi:Ig domain-containing protein [Sphingomonas ginsenosidivorax]|uniref:Ig domain-containing protein n=1 Tax=Sphingomonas ginsenosidivorax TaxID=862135 RepID=UPI0013153FD2|nr:Ig domain-containing protein [Sphingomonas ginsenosidivorax]